MAREYQPVVEGDIELPRASGDQVKLRESLGFQSCLRTEGAFLVASRLAIANADFHGAIMTERAGPQKSLGYADGSASRSIVLKTIICGLVVPR